MFFHKTKLCSKIFATTKQVLVGHVLSCLFGNFTNAAIVEVGHVSAEGGT